MVRPAERYRLERLRSDGMLTLRVVAAIAAVMLIAGVLWDAFETVVLTRRVSRRFVLARTYSRSTWHAWAAVARRLPAGPRREAALAVYGPLALLSLLALWVLLLILAYGLLLWGFGSPLTANGSTPGGLGTDLYFSGTTFLTLGLGDVIPRGGPSRAVTVLEVGTGFGMLALVVGYLPVLYQAFSRRETRISLLDAHAGSPPTAGALPDGDSGRELEGRLHELNALYEPYLAGLADRLMMPLPAWAPEPDGLDDWQTTADGMTAPSVAVLTSGRG